MSRKLSPLPRFTPPPADAKDRAYLDTLHQEVVRFARDVAEQVNRLSENRLRAHYNALTATPSLSTVYQTGDIIRDDAPEETGPPGNAYVRFGWMVTTDGTASAGSVVEVRFLTGN